MDFFLCKIVSPMEKAKMKSAYRKIRFLYLVFDLTLTCKELCISEFVNIRFTMYKKNIFFESHL